MKMKIEVDCTPEEARTFLGLPNMEAVNQMIQGQMEEHMRKSMEAMSPEAFMKTWMPAGAPGVEAMQNFMKQAMAAGAGFGAGGKGPNDNGK